MSSWDEFISSAKKAFNKAAVKVNDLADSAADSIKIETLKLKLAERYEELGKIVYEEMKSTSDVSAAEKVADKTAEIDALLAEIDALKARKEKRKAASGTDSSQASNTEKASDNEDNGEKETPALPESKDAD
ncbi:MAG: hypothetical protein ACI4QR_04930 [Eubacteriales bacterium]